MKIYIIKIALRGISPMVWRRLRIPGNKSLADLHRIIQVANGWEEEYLHQFHIYGKDYGISYEGGLMFGANVYAIYMDNFEFDVGDKFTYEYNFFEHWLVDIRIKRITESEKSQLSIYCVKGNGMPGANKSDQVEPTLNLLKAIADADSTTTFGDIRPFVEALNAVRFNRHYLNRRLQIEVATQG